MRFRDALETVEALRAKTERPVVPPHGLVQRDGLLGVERGGYFFQADRAGAKRLAVVLGGSSTVLPWADEAFPALLERRAWEREPGDLRVANLGNIGFTSSAFVARGLAAIEHLSPDLLIVYEGHNDTTFAYGSLLQAAYGFFYG